MELNRSELRKKIMTILYQINICEQNKIKYDVNDLIKNILEIDNDFVKETVYGVITNRKQIDEYANKYLKNWSLDRLGNTDQAIIRLGIYELMYTDTPAVVAINEAVELAKLYSDDAVKGMINSVLDKVYHEEKDEQ
ncbi:MAG: transcription antitermination factor NusB [Erysipelotrichaceae bacterium]|nr:transcription antitermination factor NusB [Erysipelotrichaceae bacterium]